MPPPALPAATQRDSLGQETPDIVGLIVFNFISCVGGSCRSVQLAAAAEPAGAARVARRAIAQQERMSVYLAGSFVSPKMAPKARGSSRETAIGFAIGLVFAHLCRHVLLLPELGKRFALCQKEGTPAALSRARAPNQATTLQRGLACRALALALAVGGRIIRRQSLEILLVGRLQPHSAYSSEIGVIGGSSVRPLLNKLNPHSQAARSR